MHVFKVRICWNRLDMTCYIDATTPIGEIFFSAPSKHIFYL